MQMWGADLISRAKTNDPLKLHWRVGFYGMIGAAAAILIAVCAYDASGTAINDRPKIQRAKAW
ncbi:hypothetical protein C7I85_12095 [Mesorhizobium soli]|uniref:Uncharacterized protein n=2 Tax=Pseudaminobacter soli (ex Li et al. 2025) TaxID=1295366 RepID=A0A2P7SE32_9HYPH|nr:hypothetical protein C7I85_12095 [Mesorhizobium soli]